MLEQAIIEDEVLTEADSKETFKLLTDDNLNKLKALLQKNMAMNILMHVMKDKVNEIKRTNLVVSRTFSERLEKIAEMYNNRMDDDVFKVLEQLIQFKHELLEDIEKGHEQGLTYEEKAFFDVLTEDP